MQNQFSINKVVVLGSGVMGSRIACHFANIGKEVLLLDLTAKIASDALDASIKSSPSPLYSKSFKSRIKTGDFESNYPNLNQYDWIIEVVIERLDIKQSIFEKVDLYRRPGTLVSSNTSGIPIHQLAEGRSSDFKAHFCGTHFFNPPRYLQLLEVIPTPHTHADVIQFHLNYGEKFLGKTTVLCKDTPAFIANRIGVFGIMHLFELLVSMDYTIEEIDFLTGPVIGRPKSATFRTCDVVGLDTLVHVANGVHANCPNDEAIDLFKIPGFINQMVEQKLLGSKTGSGFYRKEKDKSISILNIKTLTYQPSTKAKFAFAEQSKAIDNLKERLRFLTSLKDKSGEFYRKLFVGLFHYASSRIPEIANELFQIDSGMTAGFGWELGPFEIWEAVGIEKGIEWMAQEGKKPATWVSQMVEKKITSFYSTENNTRKFYNQATGNFEAIAGTENFIALSQLDKKQIVWQNAGATLVDLGDGILNLEFHTKMNTIGGEIISAINNSIEIAEKSFKGLVISNEGTNFSAGANVGLIFMMAIDQEWDELNFAIKAFQSAMMRVRYSSVPVVVAPHSLALGGACEMSMHADKVMAHSETYMGLVEFGVGLIPGGGGSKEFAVRLADELKEGDLELNTFRQRFLTIGQAKVSTSGLEAFELGYLRKGQDETVVSRKRLLYEAKKACLALADRGYIKPVQRKDIRVLGKTALGLAYLGADSMKAGGYISEHDAKISRKLAYVLCGGDLSAPTLVSEEYLLDLEREAFLSLCGEKKTLERLQSILTKGKILRN